MVICENKTLGAIPYSSFFLFSLLCASGLRTSLSSHILSSSRNLLKGFLCTVADHPLTFAAPLRSESGPSYAYALFLSTDHLTICPTVHSPHFPLPFCVTECKCPGNTGFALSLPLTCHRKHCGTYKQADMSISPQLSVSPMGDIAVF